MRRLISLEKRFTIKLQKSAEKMVNYCPECGGEMHYIGMTKHYVCKSCGLSCTGQELNDLHDKNRPADETEEELRQSRRKEYLKWWLSKK
jgi:tRNA(Ile2) C34 agmatinyltransferase TiaS